MTTCGIGLEYFKISTGCGGAPLLSQNRGDATAFIRKHQRNVVRGLYVFLESSVSSTRRLWHIKLAVTLGHQQRPFGQMTRQAADVMRSRARCYRTFLLLLLMLMMMMVVVAAQDVGTEHGCTSKHSVAVITVVTAVAGRNIDINDVNSWRTAVGPAWLPSGSGCDRKTGAEQRDRAKNVRRRRPKADGDGGVRHGYGSGEETGRLRRLLCGRETVKSLQDSSGALLLARASFDVQSGVAAHEALELVVAVAAAQRRRCHQHRDADAVDQYHRYREIHRTCTV